MSITTFAKGLDGRTFVVTLIEQGDAYGRNGCLTWDKEEPRVAFNDLSHVLPEGDPFRDTHDGHKGQSTGGAYYLSTLLLRSGGSLSLQGHEPAWTVEAFSLNQALDYLVTYIQANDYQITEDPEGAS